MRAVIVAVLLAITLAGCDGLRDRAERSIDAQWHRSDLVDGVLSRWVHVAPSPTGMMRTVVDRTWTAGDQQAVYLTEQARLVYAMIIGFEVSKEPRYRDAARLGAEFLLTRFRDRENGGFFLRVAHDGKVISEAKNTYGHAFALLALSHMYRVTGEERYRKASVLAWNEINLWLRDDKGAFVAELPRNFSLAGRSPQSVRSQNPLMHMFEALLAMHDATGDPIALEGARVLGDFVVNRLMQGRADGGAFIPEWYDFDWKPLETRELGGYTDIGHQFEWVHLLLSAERRGLPSVYASVAERILNYAVRIGYDEIDGGVYNRLYPDGSLDKRQFYWPQAEAMRAFFSFARASGKSDMWRRYEQTRDLVRMQFVDTKNGGWHARSSKECARESCQTDQVEPYHMTAMHHAALLQAAEKQ